jgi:DNA-binding transcriptional ArsR family regulator
VAVDQLSTTFFALSDPTRRAILERLAQGEATLNQLAEPFPLSVQAISKHLKILERAGLITRSQVAQTRPAMVRREALEEATAWLTRYQGIFRHSLDRLDEHLRQIQEQQEQERHDDG